MKRDDIIQSYTRLFLSLYAMVSVAMHVKKHLGFSGVRNILSRRFSRVSDHREEAQVTHRMHGVSHERPCHEVLPGPLAARVSEEGSSRGEQPRHHVPCFARSPKRPGCGTPQDEVDPLELEPVFDDFFRAVQRGRHLEGYRVMGNYYLCTIDGGEYFGSEKIECPGCLTRKVKKKHGEVLRCAHQIVQPATAPKRS